MAEEALELLAKDAVDDEVDGGVERHEEVRHRRQLRHLDVQNLEKAKEERKPAVLMRLIRLRLSLIQ